MAHNPAPVFRPGARQGCVFHPLALLLAVALSAPLACAGNVTRFTDSLAALHDELASAPRGSVATAVYPVTPGVNATLIFLPASTRADYGTLRASGLSAELSRRISAELEDVGGRDRAMLVVAQSGTLEFSTAFADFADVTDVVFGACRGRCRITVQAAGPGIRPRVVKVG